MRQGKYVELSVAQRTDVWRRWKAGESLHTIGRAFGRPHTSVHCLLAHHWWDRSGAASAWATHPYPDGARGDLSRNGFRFVDS